MSHHKSQVVVVRCPDDRYSPGEELHQLFQQILKEEEAEIRYEPNAFGGALEFVLPQPQQAWLWRLKIAGTLEPKIKKVVLINHTPGCGAVKAEYGSMSEEKEYEKHVELLRKAADFFEENLPTVHFIGYLQDPDGFEVIAEYIPVKEEGNAIDQNEAPELV